MAEAAMNVKLTTGQRHATRAPKLTSSPALPALRVPHKTPDSKFISIDTFTEN